MGVSAPSSLLCPSESLVRTLEELTLTLASELHALQSWLREPDGEVDWYERLLCDAYPVQSLLALLHSLTHAPLPPLTSRSENTTAATPLSAGSFFYLFFFLCREVRQAARDENTMRSAVNHLLVCTDSCSHATVQQPARLPPQHVPVVRGRAERHGLPAAAPSVPLRGDPLPHHRFEQQHDGARLSELPLLSAEER